MTLDKLKTKRVGVLGYGQEGQAVINYLRQHGIQPVLFDKDANIKFDDQSFLGADYLEHLSKVDVVFRSPGVWRLSPLLLEAEKNGLIVTSQVKWFFEASLAPIIGVTGTKGKGTTASLIYHFLQAAKKSSYLTGNIGKVQPLEILEKLSPSDLVVYELSSFQLQDLTQSPHIGVVLMVTEDHLDAHQTVSEYHEAKQSIVKFQGPNDFAIINDDHDASRAIGQLGDGQKFYFSRHHEVKRGAFVKGNILVVRGIGEHEFDLSNIPLRGKHNYENVAAAILASLISGVTPEVIEKALPSFKGLPYRLQKLPDQNGIHFFNDSISTVPETAIAAIESFTEPLIVILGGSDKGSDYTALAQKIAQTQNIKAVMLLGTTGPKIKEIMKSQPPRDTFDNLESAMRGIKKIAQAGDVVLLSPASASFDHYKNYKQRGDDFNNLTARWNEL